MLIIFIFPLSLFPSVSFDDAGAYKCIAKDPILAQVSDDDDDENDDDDDIANDGSDD